MLAQSIRCGRAPACASRVQRVTAAAQAKGAGHDSRHQTGDVTIERRRKVRYGGWGGDFFRESASEVGASQDRDALGGQRDVAEDDPDAAAIQVLRHAGLEHLPAGMEGQVKDGIELDKQIRGQLEAGRIEGDFVEEIAA